jgi:hypothetical protein
VNYLRQGTESSCIARIIDGKVPDGGNDSIFNGNEITKVTYKRLTTGAIMPPSLYIEDVLFGREGIQISIPELVLVTNIYLEKMVRI